MDLGLLPTSGLVQPTSLVPHPDKWLQQPLISKDSKVLQLVQGILYIQRNFSLLLEKHVAKLCACENLQSIKTYLRVGVVPTEIIAFLDHDGELSTLIGRSTELTSMPFTDTVKTIGSSIESLQPGLVDELTSDQTVLKLHLATHFAKLRLLMEAYTIPLCEALKKLDDPKGIDQTAVVIDVLDFNHLMHSIQAARQCLSIVSDRSVEAASQELSEMYGNSGPIMDLDKSEFLSTLATNAWEPKNIKTALVTVKQLVKEFHARIPGIQNKLMNVLDQPNTSTVCNTVFSISTIINVVIADLLTITGTQPKEE